MCDVCPQSRRDEDQILISKRLRFKDDSLSCHINAVSKQPRFTKSETLLIQKPPSFVTSFST